MYYGLGIRVRPVKNGANLFHTGSIPGTSTLAVRTADGFAWVVMFNGRPQDRNGFRGEVDQGLWAAKRKVTTMAGWRSVRTQPVRKSWPRSRSR